MTKTVTFTNIYSVKVYGSKFIKVNIKTRRDSKEIDALYCIEVLIILSEECGVLEKLKGESFGQNND